MIHLALKNLWRNSRRSAAILVTVALGVGGLFIYHGFNYGIMNQYKYNTIRSNFGHGAINTKGYREKVFEKPWEHWIINYPELKNYLEGHNSVKHIFPRLGFYSMLSNGSINVAGKGEGIDGLEEYKFFHALNIIEGKNLADEPDGVLLGKGLAQSLDVKVGDRVTVLATTVDGSLNGIDLYVTGIFHTGSKAFDDTVFRLQLEQAQILLDTQLIESVSLALNEDDQWDQVEKDIEQNFSGLEATGFAILDKIFYQHAVDFLKVQFDAIRLVILIIVVMGIFNTVSTGILERKQEIGMMRANGESVKEVMMLLCLEGFWLGFIGAIIGLIGGAVVSYGLLQDGIYMPPSPGLTRRFHVFIELQGTYGLTMLVMGPVIALVGTILAGIKVTKMQIADLLRST